MGLISAYRTRYITAGKANPIFHVAAGLLLIGYSLEYPHLKAHKDAEKAGGDGQIKFEEFAHVAISSLLARKGTREQKFVERGNSTHRECDALSNITLECYSEPKDDSSASMDVCKIRKHTDTQLNVKESITQALPTTISDNMKKTISPLQAMAAFVQARKVSRTILSTLPQTASLVAMFQACAVKSYLLRRLYILI
eukprot:CFRG3742T1